MDDNAEDRKRKRSQTSLSECGIRSLKPLRSTLEMVVSGGQSGADRAALEAAQILGLRTGGFAPKGYMTTCGPDPELGSKFGLVELKSKSYITRSKKNVDTASGTVAFRAYESPGTDNTIGYCMIGKWIGCTSKDVTLSHAPVYRPVLVIDASRWSVQGKLSDKSWSVDGALLRAFIIKHRIYVLNVCGHRESGDGSWSNAVKEFLIQSLGVLVGK
jgi:hypothetical protein